jgi:hypothetical protein
MREDWDSAELYRQRAQRLRAIAKETEDGTARKELLEVADDYDRMAMTRERIAQPERKPKRPDGHQ